MKKLSIFFACIFFSNLFCAEQNLNLHYENNEFWQRMTLKQRMTSLTALFIVLAINQFTPKGEVKTNINLALSLAAMGVFVDSLKNPYSDYETGLINAVKSIMYIGSLTSLVFAGYHLF